MMAVIAECTLFNKMCRCPQFDSYDASHTGGHETETVMSAIVMKICAVAKEAFVKVGI